MTVSWKQNPSILVTNVGSGSRGANDPVLAVISEGGHVGSRDVFLSSDEIEAEGSVGSRDAVIVSEVVVPGGSVT